MTVIFHCDIAIGERAAMSMCLAKEERMWKCLLRNRKLLPCQHLIAMHMLNPLYPGVAEPLRTQELTLTSEEQPWFGVPKVWHLLSSCDICQNRDGV